MYHKCMACLGLSNNIKFLSEEEPEGKQLIRMFEAVNNFKWINNEKFASYLCSKCKSKLEIAYEFQKKCHESYEIITKQINYVKLTESGDELIKMESGYREKESICDNFLAECGNKERDIVNENHKDTNTCVGRNQDNISEASIENKCNDSDNVNNVSKTHRNYCEKCDKRVRSRCLHMSKIHSSNEKEAITKYVCSVCTKELISETGLKAHLKLHQEDSPHKCSYCSKPHKNKAQLIDHERTHTGEKPHICSVCGKGFAQSGALGTHMKLHTGRPEVCELCQKRFCRPSELKLHLRKHSGEKPFLCTECGKAFTQKSHLMEHIKTHSDERPFKCVCCDKAFKQKSLLSSHLQIHSGYKPFQCKLCGYACFKSYRLQQHMKLHDAVTKKEKDYGCPVCPKSFTTQAMCNAHMTSSHNAIL